MRSGSPFSHRTADGEMGAGRMRYEQIPMAGRCLHDFGHVELEMRPGPLAGQQVARHRVMAPVPESVTDNAAELTGDENAHHAAPANRGMEASAQAGLNRTQSRLSLPCLFRTPEKVSVRFSHPSGASKSPSWQQ